MKTFLQFRLTLFRVALSRFVDRRCFALLNILLNGLSELLCGATAAILLLLLLAQLLVNLDKLSRTAQLTATAWRRFLQLLFILKSNNFFDFVTHIYCLGLASRWYWRLAVFVGLFNLFCITDFCRYLCNLWLCVVVNLFSKSCRSAPHSTV